MRPRSSESRGTRRPSPSRWRAAGGWASRKTAMRVEARGRRKRASRRCRSGSRRRRRSRCSVHLARRRGGPRPSLGASCAHPRLDLRHDRTVAGLTRMARSTARRKWPSSSASASSTLTTESTTKAKIADVDDAEGGRGVAVQRGLPDRSVGSSSRTARPSRRRGHVMTRSGCRTRALPPRPSPGAARVGRHARRRPRPGHARRHPDGDDAATASTSSSA